MHGRFAAIAISLVFAMAPLGAQVSGPLFWRAGNLVRRPMPHARPAAVLDALVAGPSLDERRAGLTTALPRVELLSVRRERVALGRGLVLTFGPGFESLLEHAARLDRAIEQIAKSVIGVASVRIELRASDGSVRSLASLLAEREAPIVRGGRRPIRTSVVRGALSGKVIVVSPGHGFYWHPTLGWTTQRGNIGGLIEDIHNNEIAMRYLIPYLENMGAEVISCRDRGEIDVELIADNDQGSSVYVESGAWSQSSSAGYKGGTYRFVVTSRRSTATATWKRRVSKAGYYPVDVFYRAGSNRASHARFSVVHAGGASVVTVDQTRNDRVWFHLGDYWFEAGSEAKVILDNESPDLGKVVIADAVRIGAGRGSIVRGGRTSRQPRWKECCRYWAEYTGAPPSVYNSSSGGDHADDVTCRPRYAEWRGADCYISLHTNAGGGSGTSSFIHNTSPTTGSARLQAAVQSQIVGDIRRYYRSSWVDRGRHSANFGELRLLRTMPGVLVELAFHDRNKSIDHNALHDPEFRRIGARAYARGVLRYFNTSAPFPPVRPKAVRVRQDGRRGLRVAWDVVPGATLYGVERSPDGKSFVEVAQTAATSWSTGPLAHDGLWSFRVRAINSSGRSFPSEVLTAGTTHDGKAEVLLVAGFDRLGKFVKLPENTRDYLRQHGDAIRRGAQSSLGFDACANEAVERGLVRLGDYRVVVWALGEESTADETFSTVEQARVRSFLSAGGRLLVSGAEIGWDLDRKGSSTDRAFYRNVLGARYVRDDAQTYAFAAPSSGVFAGVPSGRFDDGSGGTYNVDFPDVIAPSDAKSTIALTYAGGAGAAIARIDGNSRVVNLGFPLETVRSASTRADLMRRALRFLLAPRSLDVAASVQVGQGAPIRLHLPGEAGNVWVLAAAAGTRPGIPVSGGRVLPLSVDGLFALSVGASNGVFRRFAGVLDAAGGGSAEIRIPSDVRLRGIRFYVSGLTIATQTGAIPSVLPWYLVQVN